MNKIVFVLLLTSIAFGQVNKAALSKPSSLNERAPDVFKAKFDTTAGVFILEVHTELKTRAQIDKDAHDRSI